jgi:uncharacterized repeat protein (TIGR01451 family)
MIFGNDGQVTNDAINKTSIRTTWTAKSSPSCPRTDRSGLRKTLKSGQNPMPAPGQEVCYTIEVFNQCGQTVTDIEVCDYVPAGLMLTDASAAEWTDAGNGMLTCTIPGPLAPGASQAIQICFKVADNAIPAPPSSTAPKSAQPRMRRARKPLMQTAPMIAQLDNDGDASLLRHQRREL